MVKMAFAGGNHGGHDAAVNGLSINQITLEC